MLDKETVDHNEALAVFKGFKNGMITDNAICITKSYFYDKFPIIEQALLKAEKEHKVLEIIKGRNVWVARLKSLFKRYNSDLDVLRLYNANVSKIDYQLTQEEFNLLKEVLE